MSNQGKIKNIVEHFGIREPKGAHITLSDGKRLSYNNAALPYVTTNEAIEQSVNTIRSERAGKQLGLYSPWAAIDRLQGKSWNFAQTNVLFSKTGHGKSFTMLQLNNAWTDFEDRLVAIAGVPESLDRQIEMETNFANLGYEVEQIGRNYMRKISALNKQFVTDGGKVIILNFSFEMRAQDDVIRNLSINTSKSVANLYSSEYNVNTGTYNRLSDREMQAVEYHVNMLKHRPIYYFEISGTVEQIYTTYLFWKKANPDCKFIINIDHAGLIDRLEYQNAMAVMADLAKLTIKLRTDGCMNNIICQMNADILDHNRQNKPSSQHPILTDIHGSNEFGWAVDNAWCFPYRPEVEHLPFYGENRMLTKGLVVAAKIKSRHGSLGEVYLKNELYKGIFTPLNKDEIIAMCTKKDSKRKN